MGCTYLVVIVDHYRLSDNWPSFWCINGSCLHNCQRCLSGHLLRSCCHVTSKFPLVTPSERLCMVSCISGDFHNVVGLWMVHIPIMSPHDFPGDYFNRKRWYSIVMQGSLIIHIDLRISALDGPAESMMLAILETQVSTTREMMELCFQSKMEIGGVEVPVVLGDSVYPLLPWMVKPYCDTGNLTCDQ